MDGIADSNNSQSIGLLRTPTMGKICRYYPKPIRKGTATYIGCLTSEFVYKQVLQNVLDKAQLSKEKSGLEFPLIHRSGTNQFGKKLHYYFNYSGTSQNFTYKENTGNDLLANKTVTTHQGISLEPWGLVIIEEK